MSNISDIRRGQWRLRVPLARRACGRRRYAFIAENVSCGHCEYDRWRSAYKVCRNLV